MFNSQMPSLDDLPTSRQLIRSTILAAAGAGALLAAVILPAEYGVDPTGIGRPLGLTEMGEVKMQLAKEAEAEAAREAGTASAESVVVPAPIAKPKAAAGPTAALTVATRSDEMKLVLAPGQGAEIKVVAAKASRLTFDWSVAGGKVNYDTHADAPGVPYHGYGKGRDSAGERGELVAAFDGSHDWFWRNRGAATVTVTLRTEGAYSGIKRVV